MHSTSQGLLSLSGEFLCHNFTGNSSNLMVKGLPDSLCIPGHSAMYILYPLCIPARTRDSVVGDHLSMPLPDRHRGMTPSGLFALHPSSTYGFNAWLSGTSVSQERKPCGLGLYAMRALTRYRLTDSLPHGCHSGVPRFLCFRSGHLGGDN